MLKINKKNTLYYLLTVVLISSIIAYSVILVNPLVDFYSEQTQYGGIANFHDHFEYINVPVVGVDSFDQSISSLNVLGLGLFYSIIGNYFFGYEIISIALIINIFAVLVAASLHVKICRLCNFAPSAYWLFFLNLPLIYYSQLVGKDAISVSLLYGMLYCYLKNRHLLLLLLGLVGFLIRVQLLVYPIFLLFLMLFGDRQKLAYVLLYIICSIAGVYAMNYSGAIGDITETSSGITGVVYKINEFIPVGNLLLNPVRFIQNIILFVSAPFVGIWYGNIFYISMAPLVFYVMKNARFIRDLANRGHEKLRHFSFVVIMVLLMYPIINTRYVALIAPFIILNIYSVRLSAKEARVKERKYLLKNNDINKPGGIFIHYQRDGSK
jgi:hypothetical protein